MTRRNILIVVGVVVLGAAVVAANLSVQANPALTVTTEEIEARDLEAVVSASGKIQPKRLVNISADTSGRVVESRRQRRGPRDEGAVPAADRSRSLRTRVDNGTASVKAAEGSLEQMRQAVETVRVQLQQAQQNLARQKDLWSTQLTTREALEKAENDVRAAESALQEREKQVDAQTSRIAQERAEARERAVRPQQGPDRVADRRHRHAAEHPGGRNGGHRHDEQRRHGAPHAGGHVGHPGGGRSRRDQHPQRRSSDRSAKITIDALPDRTFKGHVTRLATAPSRRPARRRTTQATNFKVVVVLDETVPEVRPGFTCTADITTATRAGVTAVPIPAVAVRELVFDAQRPGGEGAAAGRTAPDGGRVDTGCVQQELKPGETRKETEGVFVAPQPARRSSCRSGSASRATSTSRC